MTVFTKSSSSTDRSVGRAKGLGGGCGDGRRQVEVRGASGWGVGEICNSVNYLKI